jgi:DNA polymerase-4
LVEGGQQINLFEDNQKHLNLIQSIDKLRERYGDRAVISAAGMEAKTISRWNPFNGEPPPLLANRHQ